MKSDTDTARLFYALLPDAGTVEAIDYHAAQFSPGTGKKVRPENYHITLLFLGNVAQRSADALCLDCDSIALPTFAFEINTPGWWQKAGILWLGPDSVPEPLQLLHDTLAAIARRQQLINKSPPYNPHITIMRKVQVAPQYPVIKPFNWQAGSFSLIQSLSLPDGVRYRELMSWELLP